MRYQFFHVSNKMGSYLSAVDVPSIPNIPNILPTGIAFDVSLLGSNLTKGTAGKAGKTSTGIGIIRDDKYANLGTTESRREALMSISLQTFLSEAMSTMTNGGPRDDQEIVFNCGYAINYPLQFAAMIGDVKKIRYLMKECGMDPNAKCKECLDVQPVSHASRYGHLLAVIALLQVDDNCMCCDG